MSKGHVFIVDDDQPLRLSLQNLLQLAGYEVQIWSDASSFLADIPDVVPAVIISDMCMPGMSGLELHQALKNLGRALPVIYLSGESSLQQGIDAMKLGAHEFLVKPVGREALLLAVANGIEQSKLLHSQQLSAIAMGAPRTDVACLSPREREVYQLLLKGYSNPEIMQALGISLPTTKQYKGAVMRKLGVHSLSQLLARSFSQIPDKYNI